jgi:hypothetical protein
MHLQPIESKLKPLGTKRLKLLIYDIQLSSFAFKFNLRRYTLGGADHLGHFAGGAKCTSMILARHNM